MTSYDKIWDYAEDHYGLITNAQAGALGVDKHALPAMAQRGTLIKTDTGCMWRSTTFPAKTMSMRIPWP